MNGQRIPRTPIVVDFWNLGKVPPRCLFFLTHMHADHTCGLNSSWPHPIHCTAITGRMLVKKLKIDPRLVVELEVGESKILHVIRPNSHVTITVTTVDANHCPGSAMFLFEGYFGRILYTGDFRFSPTMLTDPVLNGSKSIDVVYLDNTYCDPSCNFPTREKATKDFISLIEANEGKYTTIIIGLHNLGKEELLVKLGVHFREWVGVSQERMETLKLLELVDVFETDLRNCFFQVHPFYLVAKRALSEMTSHDVLAVLPTCLYSGRGAVSPPAGVQIIPYSDHSSFEELRSFVKSVHPRHVKPIVKSFTGDRSCINALRGDMSVFNDLLDPTPPHEYQLLPGLEDLGRPQSPLTSITPATRSTSIPKIQRSNSGSIKTHLRNRSRGVQFVSPSKSVSPDNDDGDDPNLSENSKSFPPDNTSNGTNSDNENPTPAKDEVSDSTDTCTHNDNVGSGLNTSSVVSSTTAEPPFCDEHVESLIPVQPPVDLAVITYTQSKLNTTTVRMAGSSIARTSTAIKAKYQPTLSLQESVTCARTMPVDLLVLKKEACLVRTSAKEGDQTSGENAMCEVAVDDSKSTSEILHSEAIAISALHTPSDEYSFADLSSIVTPAISSGKESDKADSMEAVQLVRLDNEGEVHEEVDGAVSGVGGAFNATPLCDAHRDETSIHETLPDGKMNNNAESAIHPEALPKLGALKATEAMFGREPHQRRRSASGDDGGGVKRKLLYTPSSSAHHNDGASMEHSAKRLKQSNDEDRHDGDQNRPVTSHRILPRYLLQSASQSSSSNPSQTQSRATYKCVCGCEDTILASLCKQCRSSISELSKTGLFRRLSKLDLCSPKVYKVLHDAIDRIVTPQPPSDLPLVSCTCGEPDTARVCLCGLEDYISGAHNELELSVDNWDWVVEL